MSSISGSTSVLQWLHLQNSGTSDIFFSCLSTILACTFMVLHLNILPSSSSSSEDESASFIKRWWSKRHIRQLRRQFSWAAVVVVAPEMLISLAAGSWRGASLGLKAFRRYGRKNVKD